ncbi:hypothetical protein I3760_14G116000 [Carya illinoinensis]|nr:hypothetical protein I3760_14G116000 [Carya illinoinensis]
MTQEFYFILSLSIELTQESRRKSQRMIESPFQPRSIFPFVASEASSSIFAFHFVDLSLLSASLTFLHISLSFCRLSTVLHHPTQPISNPAALFDKPCELFRCRL